jgi:hypothetical protein
MNIHFSSLLPGPARFKAGTSFDVAIPGGTLFGRHGEIPAGVIFIIGGAVILVIAIAVVIIIRVRKNNKNND